MWGGWKFLIIVLKFIRSCYETVIGVDNIDKFPKGDYPSTIYCIRFTCRFRLTFIIFLSPPTISNARRSGPQFRNTHQHSRPQNDKREIKIVLHTCSMLASYYYYARCVRLYHAYGMLVCILHACTSRLVLHALSFITFIPHTLVIAYSNVNTTYQLARFVQSSNHFYG